MDKEREYNSLIENEADIVTVRGKKFGIKWLKAGTQRELSKVLLKYGDDDTMQYRCASLIILNGFFKIFMFQWFVWRWFFYVKEYLPSEMTEVFEVGKKKIQLNQCLLNMGHLIGVRDTRMIMTMTAVESLAQQQATEQPTP